MWRDALRLDQPVQHRSCPVGGIGQKPLRLETETLFCPFDHGPCGAYLGLTNGAGCLDVNDDAELHIDEIVVRVSEECRSLVRSGPLRRGIGGRDELRGALASRPPSRIIEGRQILLHRTAGALRIAILAPILTRDRDLPIGLRPDQACIDCKASPANKTGRDASVDDPLEHATKNVALAKALVAGTRKRRMIRDGILNTE